MGKYDIFFFDLDGTIIDSSVGITNSVKYTLRKYGIEETDREKIYPFIGPPLTDSFARYYGFSQEKSAEAVKFYREYYCENGIYENEVYSGLEDTLKELRRLGKKLVVATSKPEVFARKILEYLKLDTYFDYIAGMELNGNRATKAEVISYAFSASGIDDLSKVLMVGDREHDVIGAHKAGIDCLGVLYGFGSLEELENAGADAIAETPAGILKYV